MTSDQSAQTPAPDGDPFVKPAPPSGSVPPQPSGAPSGPPPQGHPAGPWQPGYPPAQPVPPGPPLRPDEERMWALLGHLSFFVLSILGPVVIMLTMGKRSEFVRRQAAEALNFHLMVLIAVVVSFPLMLVLVGFLTFFAALAAGTVLSVIAALQAHNGVDYRYPFTYRFVK
ncbi:DUF4870 domain-containing protein [Streptomyces sp. NPDC001380]|uniref:DUF4870 domain-containing protein n=1 Tax=Streptomyces sp. NPDC001380 TaxID=3364566 RepID=UPI003688B0F0